MKKTMGLFGVVMAVFALTGIARAERLVVEGSTTVLPIAQRAAEEYMDKHSGVDITIRGGGSGVGLTSLIEKTCQIANSSRPIKDDELEKAATKGVSPKAHVVAMDGIAVIINASNTIDGLSKKQLKDIFTGKISSWDAAGGSGGKIVVVSRDSASGTFEAFAELALDKQKVRADAMMAASNQAVAAMVAQTPGAIGYVGLAYMSNKGTKAIEIDGVVASSTSVLNKSYKLSRPLFMYTNGKPSGLAKDFIDFILSREGQKLVGEEGYVSIL